ncbi:unnamed protein product [Chironomus riparius]|uniref:Tudor domain-containing protein n=1 Tax=Chironomus riparius TaxID=315576 RepID=A0A9N9S075_9DIPT|nr:unnamed protein product [Chironomus riparius]
MSTKDYCPRADYSNYEINTVFTGSIVSTYSKLRRLVYCVNSVDVKNFLKIDDFKYYKRLHKKPAVGAFFVYYSASRNSYYRAFNLGSNPVDPVSIKAFFIDTGECHYLVYEKKKFFYYPDAFYMPIMGIFCKIRNIPKRFKSALDFFEECPFKKLKFNIVEKGQTENDLGAKEECLIVDVEFSKNKADLEDDEDDNERNQAIKLTKSVLLKFNCANDPPIELTYIDVPFMSSEVPDKTIKFKTNQKVLVYPEMTIAPNKYYGICKSTHEASRDMETLTRLMINMNKFNITYEKLARKAVLNEMVIMSEDTDDGNRYYRGMVLEVFDEISIILYVDYGRTQPFHCTKLFKFPIEFSSVPFHTFRIHASNIQISHDDAINHTNMIVIDLTIKPMCFGVVETIDELDIVVKLYDKNGHNMKDVLERIYKPLRVPKVSKIVKKLADDDQSRDWT